MFTLQRLVEFNVISQWVTTDRRQPLRSFYYTGGWLKDFNNLPERYVTPKKLSQPIPVREKLAALINAFVSGEPRARLARPFGEGSEPIWRRMRHPNASVVEFKTWDTRTFGFFNAPNVYVATSVVLTDTIKASAGEDQYLIHARIAQTLINRLVSSEVEGTRHVDELVTG